MIYIVVLVAAVVVVLLTSLLKQTDWNPRWKNALATVLSVVVATLAFFVGEDFTRLDELVDDLPGLVLSIYGTSQLFYNFILSGTGFERKLAATGNKHDAGNV